MTDIDLCVVSPVYNEEDGIQEFYERLVAVLRDLEGVRPHVLLVDDGSSDGTLDALRKIVAQDDRVTVLSLSRNFGHQLAITCGMDAANGDVVIVMDSDLQDPPEVIPEMLEQWRAGSKVVYGVRSSRPGETRLKLATARRFYRMLNGLSEVPLPLDAGDFRLLDRQVLDVLKTLREENRYIRGLVSWIGFPQSAVVYERDSRFAGESKYSLSKMIKLATDGITSFSEKPLRFSFQVGIFITIAAAATMLYIVIAKVIEPSQSIPGYASLMCVTLFLGGVQLLSIGLLGEYVGRIYRESKERPLYVVAESLGGTIPPAPPRVQL
jgi:glycosyltransferase involved in cell wall biosynthesis